MDIKKDLDATKALWEQAESFNNASYFLSWAWTENWITSLPNDLDLQLAVVYERDLPLLAFFLGKSELVRKTLFKSNGLFLNSTGIQEYDNSLWIEYNSMLSFSDTSRLSLTDILMLIPHNWDQFFLPGLDAQLFPGNYLSQAGARDSNWPEASPCRVIVERDLPSFYVDLELVRQKNRGYLSLLSSNTRSQIRRSHRLYEAIGPIQIEEPKSLHSAICIFEEMYQLHKSTYTAMNKPSNFATQYSKTFHNNLITNRFNTKEIQLLRITSGEELIGILYNFVYKKSVFYYQSGFNYHQDKRLKPGFVSHSEAINYNAALGYQHYDFLAGDEQYKSSLATNKRRLIWMKIQKPKFKFQIESKLEKLIPLIKRRFSMIG